MGEEEAEDNEDESEPDQTAEPVAADAGDDGDRPASLWGYAEDE
jgi:hypothetical protein